MLLEDVSSAGFYSRSSMNIFRIALANIRFPATPEESVWLAEQAIAQAAGERAGLVCFPECFIPGYRIKGKQIPLPDPAFLQSAWSRVAAAAAKAEITVVLGTERVVNSALLATALVIDQDGTMAGFQDKVQIDPSEEPTYSPGSGRQVFSDRSIEIRHCNLPRRLALSRDRALGRPARRTHCVSSAIP